MLAQRFVAICDGPQCSKRTRVWVVFKMAPAVRGLQHPISLAPLKVILPSGWSWAWVSDKSATQVFCKRHTRARSRASK